MIYYTKFNSPIGTLGLVRDEECLLKIFLPNDEITEQKLRREYPNESIAENSSGFEDVISQLTEYFDGKRKQFKIKTKLEIAPFYKKALSEIIKTPYGKTTSYRKIAQQLHNPKAARAVGTANARNPLPIIIPCHRIITSSGKLGGYAGGLKMKKYLLDLESKNIDTL